MNVEYTGRQFEITPAIRKEIETGLNKIKKILGDKFEAKAILTVEKHRHEAEITINPPNGPIVSMARSKDMMSAVNEALDRLEKQALKYKTKWLSKKRKANKKFNGEAIEEMPGTVTGGGGGKTSVSLTVHKFPAVAKTTEVHLVDGNDSVALRPMTLEEAIKEAHFRDRDVFVFRDPKGKLMVLHRTREGKMELIEAP